MEDNLIETIKKTAEHLYGENKKSAVAARKALVKYSYENPDAVVAAGLNPDDFIRWRNEVIKYGCVGNIISVGAPNEPDVEMRAAHEYFNRLSAAVRPLVRKYRKEIEGPVQIKSKELSKKISDYYEKIGKISQQANFERVKKNNSDAVSQAEEDIKAIKEEIACLKKDRDALSKDAAKEMSDLRKKNKDKLKSIDEEIKAIISETRGNRPSNIWFGNYLRVEGEFKQSIEKIKHSVFYIDNSMHFRYEKKDGGQPQDIRYLPTWNGEGTITTTLSNISSSKDRHSKKMVKTAFDGSNTRFMLRRITQGELEQFGLPNKFLNASGTERLWVASIRNSTGWYEVPIMLHRPLAENDDDEILEASYVRRKVGLKHVGHLLITMKRLSRKSTEESGVAFITPTWEPLPSGNIKCCEWFIGNKTGCEEIPASIKDGFDQSVRLMKYISFHVNSARQMLEDIGETGDPSDALPSGLRGGTRSQMRHAYKAWCYKICPETATSQERENFKLSLREMREFSRKRHGKFKTYDGHEDSGTYGGDYVTTIAHLANMVKSGFGLNSKDAMAFSALLAFDERYSHLYQWAINIEKKKMRQRTDIYRNIAANIGRQVSGFNVPKADYRTRRMTDLQKAVSPSELVKWLRNYADREGLVFVEDKDRQGYSSAPVVGETTDSARIN